MALIKRLFLLLLFSFFVTLRPALSAQYASIVIDGQTGKVLHQANADAITHPASLTKMMTLYLTFKALDQKKLRLDQAIPVSKHAAGQAPCKLGLKAGSTITVKQAILGMVTNSSNDAATAMAEHLEGSVEAFSRAMTQEARRLGLNKTVFKNASGLPDKRQVTTARDMATLAQALPRDFPHYYAYFNTQSFVFKGKKHHNHNHLVGKIDGVDGLKTGFINASGFNLAASAKRNGKRIFAVVLGGKSWHSRDKHMVELIEASFKKLGSKKGSAADDESTDAGDRETNTIGDLIMVHDTPHTHGQDANILALQEESREAPHVQVATYTPPVSRPVSHPVSHPAPPAKPLAESPISVLRDIEDKYESLDALLSDIAQSPTHAVLEEASYTPSSSSSAQGRGFHDSLKPLHQETFTPPPSAPTVISGPAPPPKPSIKKSTGKKAPVKKTAGKKAPVKKASGKKSSPKKKATQKKTSIKKPSKKTAKKKKSA